MNKIKGLAIGRRAYHATQGLVAAFKHETSFKLHFGLTVLEFLILYFAKAPLHWKMMLVLSCAGTLSFELINTAIEALSDVVHPAKNPSIKLAKDSAAGAVLLMSLVSGSLVILYLTSFVF